MFTLGIFTTHLPYIALVMFYAFFWIFGVNKASSGELQLSENKITFEIVAEKSFIEIPLKSLQMSSQRLNNRGILPPNFNLTFSALQKLKHKEGHTENHWQCIQSPGHFSRPPPFLS
jgi:hypothetical protein